MAEELRLNVVAKADSKGLTDASQELHKTRDEADGLTRSLGKLEDGSFSLDHAIDQTRVELVKMRKELAETGNVRLFGDIRAQESMLAKLRKVAREVGEDDKDPTLGSIFTSLGSLPFKVRGTAIAAAAVIITAMAPALGGAIAGAVTGAVGAGGIIGGIVAASTDARVQSAWRDFASRSLTPDAFGRGAFVEPTIRAIEELESAFSDMNIGQALAKLAPQTAVLAEGFGDFGRNFMVGFNRAADVSGPILAATATGIGDMGDALGDMIGDLAESEGALEGVRAFFGLLNGTIRIVGNTLDWLSDRFHEVNTAGAAVSGGLEDIPTWLQAIAPPLYLVASSARDANDAFEHALGSGKSLMHGINAGTQVLRDQEKEWEQLNEEMKKSIALVDEFIGKQLSLDQANIGVNKALLDLQDSFAENGRHWEENTKLGIANREALLANVQALNEQREANIRNQMPLEQANILFDQQIEKLRGIAEKAGASKSVLDDLVGDYRINLTFNASANALLRSLMGGSLMGIMSASSAFFGGMRAGGGPVEPNKAYVVGENGPETLVMGPQAGQIYNGSQMAAMGSGGETGRIVVELRLNGRTIRDFSINDALARGVPQTTIAAAYP